MIDLTKITTPWGLLDPETQAALKAHGGPYEWWHGVGWFEIASAPSWDVHFVYRVKPAALIPDSIDWAHVAPGWDWMARDERGEAYVFSFKPELDDIMWLCDDDCYRVDDLIASYRRGTVDWRDSLVRRPE